MALFNKLKDNEAFQTFLKQTFTRKECRSLSLPTFLLEPIQRLCKYPLFMRVRRDPTLAFNARN